MREEGRSGSPLEAAAGAAGPDTTEVFRLLGDETRLAILLALWEAYDPPTSGPDALPFSELCDRVGAPDSGNFSYHLDKLVGHFVEEVEGGYALSNAGHKIVRAVIAGAGLEERTLPPTEVPRTCPRCDAPVEVCYGDQRLYQVCTRCQGHLGPDSTEDAPEGALVVHDRFNPAGLAHRTPEEVFTAGTIEFHQEATLVIRGVCPECSGTVEASLHLCDDHAVPAEGTCTACGTCDEARVCYVCSVCKYDISYPAWVAAFDHPAIVSFYYEHGFEMTFGLEDADECGRLWNRLVRDQEVVSRDPIRIVVSVSDVGEELRLTLDGDLDVVEIERAGRDRPEAPA